MRSLLLIRAIARAVQTYPEPLLFTSIQYREVCGNNPHKSRLRLSFIVFSGRDGNDRLYGGDGAYTSDLNDNDDLLYGGNGNDWLYGKAGNDYLDGGADGDSLYGGDGSDSLYGRDGDDEIHGGVRIEG